MNSNRTFFVYLLASGVRSTLYVGVTSDLLKRVWEHKNKAVPGFTARYGVDRLVWYETYATAEAAIRREKQIKEWKRDWKYHHALIESPITRSWIRPSSDDWSAPAMRYRRDDIPAKVRGYHPCH